MLSDLHKALVLKMQSHIEGYQVTYQATRFSSQPVQESKQQCGPLRSPQLHQSMKDSQIMPLPTNTAAAELCPNKPRGHVVDERPTDCTAHQISKPDKKYKSPSSTQCTWVFDMTYKQYQLWIYNEAPENVHMRPYGYWVCCQCDEINDKGDIVCTGRYCGHEICYSCTDFR